ncbi:MAG: class I SAM-dependent methyltransferase [Rhodospirillaceae bacterium]
MGISPKTAYVLMRTKQATGMKGSILVLGEQRIRATYSDIERISLNIGLPLRALPEIPSPSDRFLTADEFFMLIGFEAHTALDNSGYEGAKLIHDLNDPNPPEEFREKFDVIYDGGTFEHLFNVPIAFSNLYHFLNKDGFVIHDVPVNNYVDHGFYQFSPTLFWHYYGLNGYKLHQSVLLKHTNDVLGPMIVIPHYTPETNKYTRKMNDYSYALHFVAQKTSASTQRLVPEQSKYTNAWDVKPRIDFDKFMETLQRVEAYEITI